MTVKISFLNYYKNNFKKIMNLKEGVGIDHRNKK